MKRKPVKIEHLGFPGHLCVSSSCRFHLTTRVGRFLVSTIGAYVRPDKPQVWTEVGYNRKFETMVFRVIGKCACGIDCGQAAVEYSEIEMVGYNDPASAQLGHAKMIKKYERKP